MVRKVLGLVLLTIGGVVALSGLASFGRIGPSGLAFAIFHRAITLPFALAFLLGGCALWGWDRKWIVMGVVMVVMGILLGLFGVSALVLVSPEEGLQADEPDFPGATAYVPLLLALILLAGGILFIIKQGKSDRRQQQLPVPHEPPEPYRPPADVVGGRPPQEEPRGALHLLRLAVQVFWRNFGRLFLLFVVAGFTFITFSLFLCCPAGLLLRGHPEWLRHLFTPLLLPVVVPLAIGYGYATLLVVQGHRPPIKELFRPMESANRFVNVLVAGGAPYIGWWLIFVLARLLPWSLPDTLVPGRPLLDQLLRQIPGVAVGLLFLPFAFAGLDALVAKARFDRAIARSFRFATRQWRLFRGLFLVALGASAIYAVLNVLVRQSKSWAPMEEMPIRGTLFLLSWLTLFSVVVIFQAVTHALFYREFVWRDQEAATGKPT